MQQGSKPTFGPPRRPSHRSKKLNQGRTLPDEQVRWRRVGIIANMQGREQPMNTVGTMVSSVV